MARTYTQQALHIVDRMLVVAKKDNTVSKSRDMSFHASGHIFYGEARIGHAAAVQTMAALLEKEEKAMEEPVKTEPVAKVRKQMTWESLNEATRAYFYEIAQIIGDDKDVDVKPGLKNAPRLSNLKRVGLIAKSGKGVELTDLGKERVVVLLCLDIASRA